MDRNEFKSKPQHLVTDARTGEILRIVHPSNTEIGTKQFPGNLLVFGDTTLSGSVAAVNGMVVLNGMTISGTFAMFGNNRAVNLAITSDSEAAFSAQSKGNDVVFYVSGTNFLTTASLARHAALFGSDTYFSGSIQFGGRNGRMGQITGSSGLQFFDGRNNVNTDSTVVSQRLANNASTASSAAQDTNMTFHVNAGEIWEVEFNAAVTCNNTGGVNIALSAPGGSTLEGIIYGAAGASNLLNSTEMTAAGTLYGPFSSIAGGNRFVTFKATVLVGAAQGNITLQFASAVNTQTSQIIAGASFKARRATSV